MRVSVIIPVYNGERYITETILSALDQTYPDREVIVVNDGSTDSSQEKILAFRDQIIYIEQANKGVSSARNAGILRS